MTVYYYDGYSTDKLDRIIEATLNEVDENDGHLTLKNGDDIEVYADGDEWMIVDDPEYGGEVRRFNFRYDAILAILKMSRRGF